MRKWKQRLCSLLLCGAMLAGLCPTALAEDVSISYLDENGDVQSCETYATVTADRTDWNTSDSPSGWYVAQSTVNIGRVTVTGDIHLILTDGCKLDTMSCINVGKGNSLTIYGQTEGTGTLNAINGDPDGTGIGSDDGASGNITINGGTITVRSEMGAGIGGSGDGAGGEITINGGTVEATSGEGAGIGGGYDGAGGEITISGGEVTAASTGDGAGIGGGFNGGDGGTITISGNAKVTATSKINGAGIGGGYGGNGGTINISGNAKVTATGGTYGAGIGGGYDGAGGKTTINSGEVTAASTGDGAGIGGGFGGNGGQITISGNAKVTATSEGYGAGIGSGGGGNGGTINISGGTVTAASDYGAGIGGGSSLDYGVGIGGGNYGNGGKITINGGTVTAASDYGAGIGGGNYGNGGKITINGGTVTATSGEGAGIGGGNGGDGGEITINGGTVTATGGNGAGIGGGERGNGGEITISGGTVDATSLGSGAGIGGGYVGAGGQIVINGGTITALGDVGAGIGGGSTGAGGKITITGGTIQRASSHSGAGIGGGSGGNSGEITISGGTVTAASDYGAGIGGGSGRDGGTINISGGTVTAASDYGAGIGGGAGSSDGGTFTADGNAFIVASSIADQSGPWSGVIFQGTDDGKIYNSPITLTTDAAVPKDMTLVVEAGKTLIIGQGVTLTNNGTITGGGTIINNGTITGNPIDESVATHTGKTEWSSDSSSHWHPCAVADCAEHVYAKAAHTPGDWIVDQAATATTPGSRHKECTACGYTMQTEAIPSIEPPGPVDPEPPRPVDPPSGGGSSTPPTYKPDVPQPDEGGTVSVTPSRPERGDTVAIKPKPDEGYEVDKITVTDKNGKPVEVTKKPDGTYTFQQPDGKVKIEVAYKRMETPWNNPFTDVSEGDWYYEAVRFVQERGLMNGYSDGRFGPDDTLSRAQLAQILFSKEGRPGVDYLLGFSDVAGGTWYAEAVRWAASQGIVGGYGDGTFGPDDPITREQLALMLWRYSGSPAATNKELNFNDEDEISGFALEALRWAVENGILTGYGGGRLGPKGQASRAQVAQMPKNFIENQEENT